MSLDQNLRYKLEQALVAYLQANVGEYLGATIQYEKGPAPLIITTAHVNAEPQFPYLTCYCQGAPPHPDLPAEEGVKLATIIFHLKTEANDEVTADAQNRISELEAIILAPVDPDSCVSDENKLGGSVMAALNKPAEGDDNRQFKQLHIYDLFPADDVDSMDSMHWHSQLVLHLVCQNFDSH